MGDNARGPLIYRVVYAPPRVCHALDLGPTERRRVVGELDGEPFRLALNPASDSTHFLMVSRALLRRVGRDVGDTVEVRFDVEPEDHVEVPPELSRGLADHPKADAVWRSLTPGKQRIWTALVERGKAPATRERRVREVLGRLTSGQLDPRKKWSPAPGG